MIKSGKRGKKGKRDEKGKEAREVRKRRDLPIFLKNVGCYRSYAVLFHVLQDC
jgi:hypothetical protein